VTPIYVPDTSAFLKRYFEEVGSARVDWLFNEARQGALEICLIPVVQYEATARLKRVENAIRNRSTAKLPALRLASSGQTQSVSHLRRAYTLLKHSVERDLQMCKPLERYFRELPLELHLFKYNERIVELIHKHSVGVNDAAILVCLSELVSCPTVSGGSVYFMCADEQLRKAASTIAALQIESL
jgi:hypothetical protein